MSTIDDRIESFITSNNLPNTDAFRDVLADFVSGCWSDHFKFVMKDPIPQNAESKKVPKAEKIEDPTTVEARDDLRKCNSSTLNEYCKSNGLRVGGNKKELMDRVWRHLQGENSDDDMSPRTKPKKEKKSNEKHGCYGCTSKGAPCSTAATVEVDGQWFCWRHEADATEIIAKKVVATTTTKPEPETPKAKSKPVAKSVEPKTSKTTKAKAEPEITKSKAKVIAKIAKPIPEPELESEPEQESEQDSDHEDQQETDNELVETDEE